MILNSVNQHQKGDTLPNSEVDRMLQVAGVQDGWVDYRTWVKVTCSTQALSLFTHFCHLQTLISQ